MRLTLLGSGGCENCSATQYAGTPISGLVQHVVGCPTVTERFRRHGMYDMTIAPRFPDEEPWPGGYLNVAKDEKQFAAKVRARGLDRTQPELFW